MWGYSKSKELKLLEEIHQSLFFNNQKLEKIMATVADIQTELDKVKTDYETVKAQNATIIAALQAQIAAGGGASEADLQAILDKATAVDAEVAGDINAAAGTGTGTPASGATA